MLKIFYKYEWFRNWSNKSFLLVGQPDSTVDSNSQWIEESEYQIGDKIIDRHLKKGCKMWCACGSEINNKFSFVRRVTEAYSEFDCSHCRTKQYWTWGIIPGFLPCDKNGKPL